MTATKITQAKELAFAFAQEKKLTKKQAISFAICGLVAKGFSVQASVTEVCGERGWILIRHHGTPEEIMQAVLESYF